MCPTPQLLVSLVKKRLLAYLLPLLIVFSAASAAKLPPVFSAGSNAGNPGGKGFGILVKWRGVCTAVMPKHVADDLRRSKGGMDPRSITIELEHGPRSLLTDNSRTHDATDLYVSIFQTRPPAACQDAPDLQVMFKSIEKAAETPRDGTVPIQFFINSFGKSSSLQARHLDELGRLKMAEFLEYRLRECAESDKSQRGCTPPVVGYSGIPIWMSGAGGEPIFVALHQETCNDPMKCKSDGVAFWTGITVVQIYKFYSELDGMGVFGPMNEAVVEPKSESPDEENQTRRKAQRELARLNCDPGPADGHWGARSVRAYERFRRAYKSDLGKEASPTLDAVRAMSETTPKSCPDLCGPGDTYANGVCTAQKQAPATRKLVTNSKKIRSNNVSAGGKVCFTFTTPTGVEHACKVQ